jgi:Cache domain
MSISDQEEKRIAWRRRYQYLALLLLAILPAGLYLYSTRRTLDRQREEQALEGEEQLARLSAALLQEHLQQGIAFMQAYASRDEFRQSWETHAFAEVTGYLKEAHSLQRDFLSFQALDLSGTLLAIYPPDDALMKRNFAAQDWYQGLSRSWDPYVSELFRVSQSPNPMVVAVAVPLRDTKGKPIGILMAPYALGKIGDWLSGIQQQGTSTISLVDQKGHLTVFPVIDSRHSALDASGSEPVRKLLDGKAGKGVFWRGKEKLLVAYEPIPVVGWGILAEEPATAALKTTRFAEVRLLVFGLLFVALTMGCGVLKLPDSS